MIRRVVSTGAKIEIVRTDVPAPRAEDAVPQADEPLPRAEAARQLAELGGVGALLRFG